MEQEDKSILAALRQEPEQTAFLIKFSLVAAAAIVGWDILASMALPMPVVKAVGVLLLFGYGAMIVFVVARIMVSSRAYGYAPAASGMTAASALRRIDRSPSSEPDRYALATDDDSGTPPHVANRPGVETVAIPVPPVFNEQYFMMRLREQVKDARRDGRQMCVAAIEVNVPGGETTADEMDRIAFEMARIGSQQWKIIGQPLAIGENEYVFSLPTSNVDDARLFVREVVQSLGEYWCHFGIAMFPKNATDAEGLLDQAREACEDSRQGGKQAKARYPLSA
jgi:GGDEF domain-containing protein